MTYKVQGENGAMIKKTEYWFGLLKVKFPYKFICMHTLFNLKTVKMKYLVAQVVDKVF